MGGAFGLGKGSYLAYTTRTILDVSGKIPGASGSFRHIGTIELEVMPWEFVQPLVDDSYRLTGNESPELVNALDVMRCHGMDSDEFNRAKLDYFGEKPLFMFQWHPYGRYDVSMGFFSPGVFLRLDVIDPAFGADVGYASSLHDDDDVSDVVNVKVSPFKPGMSELISKLFRVAPSPDADASLGYFAKNIRAVRIQYVGAGLCAGLYDDGDALMGFFDLGCIPGGVSAGLRDAAIRNRDAIIQLLRTSPGLTVVISHWHNDHVNLIHALHKIDSGAELFKNGILIVPDSDAPSKLKVQSYFKTTATIHTIAHSFPGGGTHVSANVVLGKVDAYDIAKNGMNRHPHHHGLYMHITHHPSKTYALLAGDCTYSGIQKPVLDDIQNGSRCWLQASHHGGDYALAPESQTDRRLKIPKCPTISKSSAIYSANGLTYGHPDSDVMIQHIGRGWGGACILYSRITYPTILDYHMKLY
ncbi:MAG: hypothetical protein FWE91_07145 [Defluviitaleaceae bacterium]|nr:hypothetical protein [Defluviitaleaceae bacterium]MCL2836570.1 hypothetical protein [Defluviitaleaceae bacterium]